MLYQTNSFVVSNSFMIVNFKRAYKEIYWVFNQNSYFLLSHNVIFVHSTSLFILCDVLAAEIIELAE